MCGNGVIDEGEECDGMALDGMNCVGLGFPSPEASPAEIITSPFFIWSWSAECCRVGEGVAVLGGTEKFPGRKSSVFPYEHFHFFHSSNFCLTTPTPFLTRAMKRMRFSVKLGCMMGKTHSYRRQIKSSSSPHTHLHGK